MCGIAGVIYRDSARPLDQSVLKKMGDAIAHRGPDAEGFLCEPGIGLVHRRLSIIDLAGGDQPIGNEDGSVQIVFNGEIYNYPELRHELKQRGHTLRTSSDTEVLVHLYEDEGEQFVNRLRGMFAFALWDRPRRRLFLGRDRLGIKPLYWCRDSEKVVFGSELKAILAHGGVAKNLDIEALDDYLAFGFVPGTRSIFAGISKLPPAHLMRIAPDDWSRSPRSYWQLEIAPDESLTESEWQERIRAKVDEAVRLHLISDVPVGAFLSGGVDSAVIVACGVRNAQSQLQTFSLGFREQDFSELPAARETAAHFDTRHVEDVVTPDATQLLGELTHYFDEPFADTSAIPTFLLARLARRNVKVALSGDGGDEAFGGYARYAHDLHEATIRNHLPLWLRRGLGKVASIWPKSDWLPRPLRAKTFLTNIALDAGMAYGNTLQICRHPERRRILATDVGAQINGHRPELQIHDSFARAPVNDALAGMIAADIATFLPDDYLVKVDRASMAHGLEVRPPLLDHELLEMAVRIPSRFKIYRGETKYLFKRAFRDRLPAQTTIRPKQGFEIPINQWLRGPLREMFEDCVLGRSCKAKDLVNQAEVQKLFQSHCSGVTNLGNALWSILVLSRWCDRYLRTA